MNISQRLSLTTNELVAVLALCGFERAASQILNDQDLIQNENQFDRFVEQSEQLLKERGYWDDSRETKLASGLESMIRLLVNCSKKVRCVNGNNVMILHLLNDKYFLSQHVTDKFHTFTFFQHSEGYQTIMNDLLGLKEYTDVESDKFQTIELSTNVFDEFHHLEQSVLHSMINDSEVNVSLRTFLKDFLKNEQKLDNISFLKSNYVKDQTTAEQIIFLLPSNGFVWHIDYEQVQQNKLFIVPISENIYVTKIEETIESFFQLKPTASYQ